MSFQLPTLPASYSGDRWFISVSSIANLSEDEVGTILAEVGATDEGKVHCTLSEGREDQGHSFEMTVLIGVHTTGGGPDDGPYVHVSARADLDHSPGT